MLIFLFPLNLIKTTCSKFFTSNEKEIKYIPIEIFSGNTSNEIGPLKLAISPGPFKSIKFDDEINEQASFH